MNNQDYYFIKPYDNNLAKPPVEGFNQILNENFYIPSIGMLELHVNLIGGAF